MHKPEEKVSFLLATIGLHMYLKLQRLYTDQYWMNVSYILMYHTVNVSKCFRQEIMLIARRKTRGESKEK